MQQQQQNSYSTCKINNVDSIRTKYLCSMNYRDRCRITSGAANRTAAGGVVVQTRLRLHRVVVIVVDEYPLRAFALSGACISKRAGEEI